MITEETDDMVEEEVGALEAILMDDVLVIRTDDGNVQGVEVCVVPATAQKVSEQHVRCTLVVKFPPNYPTVQPSVTIRNPRGIDDSILSKIEQEVKSKCRECEGSPVIYELVELVRDNLTANNAPSCPCAICLHHFTETDQFTKTHCFHYFHKHCLGRYASNSEAAHLARLSEQQLAPWQQQQDLVLLCPVCRESITLQESASILMLCPSPALEDSGEQWRADAPEVVALRQSMAKLFLKQKQRGGIIDLEQEKNKYLVSQMSGESRIENVPLEEVTEETTADESQHLTPEGKAPEANNSHSVAAPVDATDGTRCTNGHTSSNHDTATTSSSISNTEAARVGNKTTGSKGSKNNSSSGSGESKSFSSNGSDGPNDDIRKLSYGRRDYDASGGQESVNRSSGWGNSRGSGGSGRRAGGGNGYHHHSSSAPTQFKHGRGAGGRGGRGGGSRGGGDGHSSSYGENDHDTCDNDRVQQQQQNTNSGGGYRGRNRGGAAAGSKQWWPPASSQDYYHDSSASVDDGYSYYNQQHNSYHSQQYQRGGNQANSSRQYYNNSAQQNYHEPQPRYAHRQQQNYSSNSYNKQYPSNHYRSRPDDRGNSGRSMPSEARNKMAANERPSGGNSES
uniref:E3 ubiquitin-protein ligase RNF25-like n=1 Tax=Hirondellea gigas TaxID=1518452 RepID=A0A2P2ICL7_9CRUS